VLSRWVLGLLQRRFMPVGAVVFSLLLCSSALSAGLVADDYIHQLILHGADALPAYKQHWSALFAFATDDNRAALMDVGVLPWWSDPALRLAFFRPLSALTHWLDAQLWPGSPWLMHLHSLVWSALAMFAAYALYRRVFALAAPASAAAAAPPPSAAAHWLLDGKRSDEPPQTQGVAKPVQPVAAGPEGLWLARLALLFYALEPTRSVAVGWIANRNTLVSLSLSLAAVCLHLDGLRAPLWLRRVGSPLLLALAVLAGEGGVSGLAFLVAAALLLDPRGRTRGLLALWPHFAAAGGVVALGGALGYGVVGSDAYLDPRSDALAYLTAFPARALALVAASVGGPAADLAPVWDLLQPGLGRLMQLVSLLLIALLGLAFRPLFRRSLSARYFGLALCLALPPACVAFSADRLLTWISLSAVALLAECALVALRDTTAHEPRGLRLAAAAILGARVLFAPLLLAAQARNISQLGDLLQRADQIIPNDPAVTDRIAVFVNAPEEPLVSFVLPQRALAHAPQPAALRRMAAGFTDVAITRTGPDRVEVLQAGGFLQQHTERLLRSPRTRPFASGDRIAVTGMQVEVLSVTDDGRPLRVAFRFDPERHDLYALTSDGYERFELPALGTCVELHTPSFLTFVLGQDNQLAQLFAAERSAPLCPAAQSDTE
jgi:hypothetical protein